MESICNITIIQFWWQIRNYDRLDRKRQTAKITIITFLNIKTSKITLKFRLKEQLKKSKNT